MTRLMIVVASVRPGRVGLPVAEWARRHADADDRFEVDLVDLAELALPFMDEPAHPAKRQYTKPHTLAWSERADAADAFLFVTPEYNHSYAPALKNAIDYLFHEWTHKAVGLVSYGGVAAGSRGAVALQPVLSYLRMVKTGTSVEIPFVGRHVADGAFTPEAEHESAMRALLGELAELDAALRVLRG